MRDVWQKRPAQLLAIAALVVVGVTAALVEADISGAVQVLLLGVVAVVVAEVLAEGRQGAAQRRAVRRRLRRLDTGLERSARRTGREVGRLVESGTAAVVAEASGIATRLMAQQASLTRLDERATAVEATVSSLEAAVGSLSACVVAETTAVAATVSSLEAAAGSLSACVAAESAAVSDSVSGTVSHAVSEAAERQERQDWVLAQLRADLAGLAGDSSRSLRTRLASDVAALLALHGEDGRELLPVPSGWALSPQVLGLAVRTVRARPDLETVVELGSGVSTSWVARALRERGSGRLVSFEHDAEYGAATTAQLSAAGLASLVDLRCSPLAEVDVGAERYRWYQGFEDLHEIGLLLVDGPPGGTGPQARYPAGPLLLGRMADDGLVVLDDAERDDEETIIERWLGLSVGGRTLSRVETVDRAAVLRVARRPA